MAERRKQKEQPEDQEGIRHLSKLRKRDLNPKMANKNISIGKSLKRPKKFLFPIKLDINLILFLSMILLINCQRKLRSTSSFITLRLNHSSYFLNASFLPLPDQVYIDDTPQERSKWEGKFINITSMYQVIKLEWNDKLINTSAMFSNLIQIIEVDLSNFDSSLVIDTSYMFKGCDFLGSINFNGFTTSSVKTMRAMFYWMGTITSIDVSHFDTSQVTDMGLLFNRIGRLTSIDVSNFNTSSVTNMEGMFGDSAFLFLNLSNFDTRKVQTMQNMLLPSVDLSCIKQFRYIFMWKLFIYVFS